MGKCLELFRARGDQLKTETKLGRGQAVDLPQRCPLSSLFDILADPITIMDARGPPK